MKLKYKYKTGEKLGECIYLKDCDNKENKREALFECGYCGNIFKALICNVKNKHTRSCGCLQEKIKKSRLGIPVTHGDSIKGKFNYLYRLWTNIKYRCTSKNSSDYYKYGERGIKVYEKWSLCYSEFKTYILKNLGERPKGYTLDRIDNNGDYEPGNVRWATYSQQNRNRRKYKWKKNR